MLLIFKEINTDQKVIILSLGSIHKGLATSVKRFSTKLSTVLVDKITKKLNLTFV